jgi:hypothetical protein
MIPFADALFGGSLVSVVICQGCKSVSGYEFEVGVAR